jgi:hypothetical protein
VNGSDLDGMIADATATNDLGDTSAETQKH